MVFDPNLRKLNVKLSDRSLKCFQFKNTSVALKSRFKNFYFHVPISRVKCSFLNFIIVENRRKLVAYLSFFNKENGHECKI